MPISNAQRDLITGFQGLASAQLEYDILVKLAGSGSSGNFGHGGRQGKVGGSVSKAMLEIANYRLSNYTGAQLAEAQRLVSETNGQRLLDQFDESTFPTEVTRAQLEHWVDRLEEHRGLILQEALLAQKEGVLSLTPAERKDLEQRLVYHDMDKYRWDVAEPYIMGGLFSKGRGPRDDTYIEASKDAVRKHHEINDHHPRYWNKKETVGGEVTYRPTPMSNVALAEMVGDLRGTSREKGTDVNQWYARNRGNLGVHTQTQRVLDKAFKYTPPPPSKSRDDAPKPQQAKTPDAKPVAQVRQRRAGPITKYRIPGSGSGKDDDDNIEFDFDAPPKKRKKAYEELTRALVRSRG